MVQEPEVNSTFHTENDDKRTAVVNFFVANRIL